MTYVNSVTFIVRWLAIAVACIDLSLVAYILYRRVRQNRYFAHKDAAQQRVAPIIAEFLSGTLPFDRAVQVLTTRDRAERDAIRTEILARMNTATRQRGTELLIALGYVQQWAQQAFGKRWIQSQPSAPARVPARLSVLQRIRRLRILGVRRAMAVANLGRLSADWSSRFMKLALRDPSPLVARLSVAALGRNPVPDGVPILLQELQRAVLSQTEVPTRSIRTALVRYPIGELRHFTACMDHANPRFRFLAVDTIREVCRKAEEGSRSAFPADLRQWFLDKAVCDNAADVRARSATVISWFRNEDASARLRRLLQDDNEFVRLHTVRACADPHHLPKLLADLLQLVTDKRWRVREAAVRALASSPSLGRQALAKLFLDTTDRYASEQIADELQRSGMVLQIVPLLDSPNGERQQAFDVCAKMARLGMDSLLIEHLMKSASIPLRKQMFEALQPSGSPQFLAALQRIAGTEMDPLHSRAESFLRARQTAASAAAGGQPA